MKRTLVVFIIMAILSMGASDCDGGGDNDPTPTPSPAINCQAGYHPSGDGKVCERNDNNCARGSACDILSGSPSNPND